MIVAKTTGKAAKLRDGTRIGYVSESPHISAIRAHAGRRNDMAEEIRACLAKP